MALKRYCHQLCTVIDTRHDTYRVHRLIFVAICNANNWAQLDCF
jgi:hypothetical protein